MFPEYRELISQLQANDPRFDHLVGKHHELDRKIQLMEAHVEPASHEDIEVLKKKKLRLKDEIYELLRKASAPQPA